LLLRKAKGIGDSEQPEQAKGIGDSEQPVHVKVLKKKELCFSMK
jgi:hypothetical protein